MTKSAKQDPKKVPAESAATESAATQAEAEAQPEVIAEPADPGEPGEAAAEESGKTDLDETKRKFREALERKQQAHSESQGRSGRDGSKINSAHGPAASRRNFRRKSG